MNEGKKIVNIILSVISITLAAKFLGFFRDALLGSKIGATFESDAYIMALNSTTIIFLSIGSAISTGAIPLIVKQIKENNDKTNDFLNKLISAILLGSVFIVVLGIIFAPNFLSVVAKGFQGEKMDLVITLTRIMFPSLIFIGIAYIFVAYLQSIGKFIVPAFISFPFNILLILYLVFFLQDYGILGLAIATLFGWSLQLFIQIPFALKEGFRFKFTLNFQDDDIRRFFKSIIPIVFVASLHQVNILVDNMYASTLGHGKVSSIYYANILYQALVTTTVFGISSVMFPKFNLDLSEESMNRFKYLVRSVLGTVVYILVPMAVGLIILDDTIISLVFERGQFNSETTQITAMMLSYYGIGMVGFGLIDILNKAFYSLNNLVTPVIISFAVILVNFILSKILLSYMGFKGVALATSISLIIGAIILLYVFKRKTQDKHMGIFIVSTIKTLLASIVMALVIMGIKGYLGYLINLEYLHGKLIYIFTISILGIMVYAITTVLLKDKTSIFIYDNYIKSKFRK